MLVKPTSCFVMRFLSLVCRGTLNAERTRRVAQMLVAGLAQRTLAAADPRKHDAPGAFGDITRFRSDRNDGTGDLVTERARRRDDACQVELVSAAEVEIAVGEVHVAVADAATIDFEEHFAALWLRRVPARFDQRLAELIHLETSHRSSERSFPIESRDATQYV